LLVTPTSSSPGTSEEKRLSKHVIENHSCNQAAYPRTNCIQCEGNLRIVCHGCDRSPCVRVGSRLNDESRIPAIIQCNDVVRRTGHCTACFCSLLQLRTDSRSLNSRITESTSNMPSARRQMEKSGLDWPFRLRGSVDKPQQGRKTRTQFRLFFSPFPLHRHQRLRTQRVHRRKGIRQRCAATAALGMAYSDWPKQKMDSLLIHGRPFEVPGKEARPGKEPPQLCGPHLKPSSEPLPPLTVSASPFCLDLGKPVGAVSDANRLLIGSRHGPSQRPPSSSGCTLPVLVLHLTLLSSTISVRFHMQPWWVSPLTSVVFPPHVKLLTERQAVDFS
jgi:hypothetical protein